MMEGLARSRCMLASPPRGVTPGLFLVIILAVYVPASFFRFTRQIFFFNLFSLKCRPVFLPSAFAFVVFCILLSSTFRSQRPSAFRSFLHDKHDLECPGVILWFSRKAPLPRAFDFPASSPRDPLTVQTLVKVSPPPDFLTRPRCFWRKTSAALC